MPERYTSDFPALPDQEYIVQCPEFTNCPGIDEWRADPETIPDDLRPYIGHLFEKRNEPKQPDLFVQRVFEEYGAQFFIDTRTVYTPEGRLDLDLTSQSMGIPYNYNMKDNVARAEIIGLHPNPNNDLLEIHLRAGSESQTISFGHEIGHFFWRAVLGWGTESYDREEEDFCDYFGRRMALPLKFLSAYASINEQTLLEMMIRFDTGPNDLIEYLMEYGLLPERVAIDSYTGKMRNLDFSEKVERHILCKHCNSVGGDFNCPEAGKEAILFDFTDRAWSDRLSSCCGEKLHNKPAIMSTLTKYYQAHEEQLVLFRPGASFEYESD